MKRAIGIGAVLLVVAAIVVGGWWFLSQNPEWLTWAQEQMDAVVTDLGLEPQEGIEGLVASGFIEAEEAAVTTEIGGRIVALHAAEGDQVTVGATLVELDDSLHRAQIEIVDNQVMGTDSGAIDIYVVEGPDVDATISRNDIENVGGGVGDYMASVFDDAILMQIYGSGNENGHSVTIGQNTIHDVADDAVPEPVFRT